MDGLLVGLACYGFLTVRTLPICRGSRNPGESRQVERPGADCARGSTWTEERLVFVCIFEDLFFATSLRVHEIWVKYGVCVIGCDYIKCELMELIVLVSSSR